MEIEINGLIYQEKEQNNQRVTRHSKMSTMIMGMAMIFGAQGSIGTSKRERESPKVNIVEEYKLIQEKKSKLPRKDREWVVFQFNRHYELVAPK
jgi:hypothetical protein